MAIGANWAEVWAAVWGPVWTQEAAEPPAPAPAPVESNSGGWALFFRYEQERERRRRRKRELEEAEEATQELPPVDKEIAKLLHKQERIDAEREHLERLRTLVREYQPTEALPQRVSDAILKAQTRETMAALRQLDKALRQMMEEEEMAVLMLLLND